MSASPTPTPQLPIAGTHRNDAQTLVPPKLPVSFAATLAATATEAGSHGEQQLVAETDVQAAVGMQAEPSAEVEPEGDAQPPVDSAGSTEAVVPAAIAAVPPPSPPPPAPSIPPQVLTPRVVNAAPQAAAGETKPAANASGQGLREELPDVATQVTLSRESSIPSSGNDASNTLQHATGGGKPVEGAAATVEPAPATARRSIFAVLRGDDRAERNPTASVVEEPTPAPTPTQVMDRTAGEVGQVEPVEADAPVPRVATGGEPMASAQADTAADTTVETETQTPAPEVRESTVVGVGAVAEPAEWVREVATAMVALAEEGDNEISTDVEAAQPAISETEVAANPALRSQSGSAVTTPDASHDMAAPVPLRTIAEPQRSESQPKFVTLPFEAPDGGSGRLRVAVIGDQVHATMLVEPRAVASLELALPELRRALDAKGYGDAQLAVRANAADGLPVATAPARGEQAANEHAGRETPERRANHFDQRREDARQHRHHPDEEAE